jgi:hypothetical protein
LRTPRLAWSVRADHRAGAPDRKNPTEFMVIRRAIRINNVSAIHNNWQAQSQKQTLFQCLQGALPPARCYHPKLQKRIFTKKHARV